MNINTNYNLQCRSQTDICEHLPTLRRYALECKHITEMGMRDACSTWAFLDAKPVRMISYDLETPSKLEYIKGCCKEEGIDYEFRKESTLDAKIDETDLLFIDTLHTYDQLKMELDLHSNKVGKYMIFHDTETYGEIGETPGGAILNPEIKGLNYAIRKFLAKNKNWNIKEVFSNNNGLTILERGK